EDAVPVKPRCPGDASASWRSRPFPAVIAPLWRVRRRPGDAARRLAKPLRPGDGDPSWRSLRYAGEGAPFRRDRNCLGETEPFWRSRDALGPLRCPGDADAVLPKPAPRPSRVEKKGARQCGTPRDHPRITDW